jgi:hypothetical protein
VELRIYDGLGGNYARDYLKTPVWQKDSQFSGKAKLNSVTTHGDNS